VLDYFVYNLMIIINELLFRVKSHFVLYQ